MPRTKQVSALAHLPGGMKLATMGDLDSSSFSFSGGVFVEEEEQEDSRPTAHGEELVFLEIPGMS